MNSFRRARLVSSVSVAALLLACSVDLCWAIDNSICGLWRTVISRPNGDITVDWKIEPSGSYTVTSSGPGGRQSESGRISTQGNSYSKTTNIGPDNGTFQVISNQKFTTTGRFGYIEWTRVGGGGVRGSFSPYQNDPPMAQSNGYNPDMNPRSAGWAKMGFGQVGTTKDQSGWTPGNKQASANLQGSDLKSLLFSNFPVKGADEVEQFGLPALGKAAAGGMRKRDFRLIQ